MKLMSRHDFGCPMEIGVATPCFEVVIWVVLVGQEGGCDMGLTSRPGRNIATWPGQGLGQFGVATWSFEVAT